MQVWNFCHTQGPYNGRVLGKKYEIRPNALFWSEFDGIFKSWRNLEKLVEILRFIFMKVYNISLSTLNMSVFHPVLPSTSVNQVDK